MKVSNRQGLGYGLCVAVLAAAMGASPASAAAYRNASAGAACHAANGALASKFTFNLNYLTNIGTTDAYVICSLPMDDASTTPDTIIKLSVSFTVPAALSTVTCVAQAGNYVTTNNIYHSAAESRTTASANQSLTMQWENYIPRGGVINVVTLNCKLPPGTKMGLIERWENQIN